MRRLIVIGVLAICVAFLTGVVANGRAFIRAGGWATATYKQTYFGPNSSYVPSLDIDFQSHQGFDVIFQNVSQRSIGVIRASIKLRCQGPIPAVPAHAANRPSPLAAYVPARFRPDGSFSFVQQERWNPQIPSTESTFRISGRFHGRTASGTLSYDFNQPVPLAGSPSPTTTTPTTTTIATTPSGLDCHSGQVSWHATWHNYSPTTG
jgi:hypothetical protein